MKCLLWYCISSSSSIATTASVGLQRELPAIGKGSRAFAKTFSGSWAIAKSPLGEKPALRVQKVSPEFRSRGLCALCCGATYRQRSNSPDLISLSSFTSPLREGTHEVTRLTRTHCAQTIEMAATLPRKCTLLQK